MKIAFFLVALANVALFMWEHNKRAESLTEDSKPFAYNAQEQIVLVKEINRTEAEVAEKDQVAEADAAMASKTKEEETSGHEAEAQPGVKKVQSCYDAGPFANVKTIEIWHRQLSAVGVEVKVVSQLEKVIRDYQVYYPAADTPELSLANLKMLRSQGYPDAWMLREGDEVGSISLGVFKKEEHAVELMGQIRAKDIQAEVRPRYKEQLQKHVLIEGGSELREHLDALEKTYPGVVVKSSENC